MVEAIEQLDALNQISRVFGQHVSPQVVERLLEQPHEDATELRHVCLMFLDIRDFTALSSTRAPEEVVTLLNHLFSFMIETINDHNGIINKFLGDGFLAVFGAPLSDGREVLNAVEAAEAILNQIDAGVLAGELPPIRVGIGLHAGEAITGNVGSARRKEYTIIGDAVNVAARIEQLNKRFESQLLVSQAVWDALGRTESGIDVHHDVEIRGHDLPVKVYQLN